MSNRKRNNSLTNYFCKKIKTTENETITSSTSTAVITDTLIITESTNDIIDIGCCLDQKVSNELKYKLLTNV